ncbi:hypothetical protein B0H16DRAFT_1891686 [Mycena metata]|uniref:F-box domain-containing protein n=1 Tax=Mycena metata TaxID=1033252 RepID=A0AAD7I9N5_9AGAR|nr:hypothetical protein B0H16DRAFT_1891686 [Mycena metata]
MPPVLPMDIEREVFEATAYFHHKSIPTLLLVAHRVKKWVEPLLYRVVVFTHARVRNDDFTTRLSIALQSRTRSHSDSDLLRHVHHLLFTQTDSRPLHEVLAKCTAVQNLVLLHFPRDSGFLPLISGMPLRRLTTTLSDLFFPAPIDFAHPLFAHLTHLELVDNFRQSDWDGWKGLALIPNLTHLAFLFEIPAPIINGALADCPALQILIILESWPTEVSVQDPRFLIMKAPPLFEDWNIGARGGDDLWVRAEKFIARRKSSEVERGGSILVDP